MYSGHLSAVTAHAIVILTFSMFNVFNNHIIIMAKKKSLVLKSK